MVKGIYAEAWIGDSHCFTVYLKSSVQG